MDFFKMIGKRGAARTLARSAHEAFLKYKADNPDTSEAEIAEELFNQRCSPGNLNKAEKLRFNNYHETEETVDSIYKLCFAVLYIVDDISKDDVKSYSTARKIIEEELTRSGYKIPSN